MASPFICSMSSVKLSVRGSFLCPDAARILFRELIERLLENFEIVGGLETGDSQEIYGFGRFLTLWVLGTQFAEMGDDLLVIPLIQPDLSDSKHESWYEILRREESLVAVDLVTVLVNSNKSRGPLDTVLTSQWLLIIPDAYGNNMLTHKIRHGLVRIRNCIHLLATHSVGVEEIQE